MDRARRAGFTALIVVVMVAAAGGFGRAWSTGGGGRLAAVDARRLGGADRRRIGLGRIRRGRQPGWRPGRPRRPGGRLRHCDRLDRDAQGDMVGGDDPRPGQAHPACEYRRCVCAPSPT